MKRLRVVLTLCVSLVACAGEDGSPEGSEAGPASCSTSTSPVLVDDGGCLVAGETTGVCVTSLHFGSLTTERVCMVSPQGDAVVIQVNGDDNLSGDGWQFGPRSAGYEGTGIYPVEKSNLAPQYQAICASLTMESVCGVDGGEAR